MDARAGDARGTDDAKDSSHPRSDAPSDAPVDMGMDAGHDAGEDAKRDAATDAKRDVAADANADVVTDASGDVVTDATLEGGEAGPPSLCNPTFLFCDGFENGLSTWSQVYESGGAPSVDSTHVYRGTYALHAHIDPVVEAGATAYAEVQQIQAWPTHVFTRIFVYQPSPHPATPSGLLDLLAGSAPYSGIELLTDPPSGGIGKKTYNEADAEAWTSEAGAITLDEWVCFELEEDVAAGTSHLYMNDVEVTDMARTSLGLSSLGILGVGLSFLTPDVQPGEDLWIDEVAVNTTRITCAK
jgi:hypothetical protein